MKNLPTPEKVSHFKERLSQNNSFVKFLRASMFALFGASMVVGGGVCCSSAPKPEVELCDPVVDKSFMKEPGFAKEITIYTLENLKQVFPDIKPGINEAEFVYRGVHFLARLALYPDEIDGKEGMGLALEITTSTPFRARYRSFTPLPNNSIEL